MPTALARTSSYRAFLYIKPSFLKSFGEYRIGLGRPDGDYAIRPEFFVYAF